MITQSKNLKDALKKVGIKARVRTEVNSHGEYGDAVTVIKTELLTEEKYQSLLGDGCKFYEGSLSEMKSYTVVRW